MGSCIVTHACSFQVAALERDALEVLRMGRFTKNSLAPVNRVPPEVLSLIPDYYDQHEKDIMDQDLVALTHVCRRWRDVFTSRSALWTRFDFRNTDKTRTFIQRSKSSLFTFYLGEEGPVDDAFALIIPHIRRLKSLTLHTVDIQTVLPHFRCHTPFLEELDIRFFCGTIDDALFNGDLSSLRVLRLSWALTHFPWINLVNLRVFDWDYGYRMHETTRLLDIFESAPLLHTISLRYKMPDSSDAPPGRILPLHNLKVLTISTTKPTHSILLRHLHIPIGVSLTLKSPPRPGSPLLDYLTGGSLLNNLSHITAVNLLLSPGEKSWRISGPSGSLRVLPTCVSSENHTQSYHTQSYRTQSFILAESYHTQSFILNRKIFLSLDHPMFSTIERLTITLYGHPKWVPAMECPLFQTLSSANHLRTLTLAKCDNLPFILALDPERNSIDLVPCPKMEDLVLYIESQAQLHLKPLLRMVENRASRGAKLSSITLVYLLDHGLKEEVLKLEEHVMLVNYRTYEKLPPWDEIPCGSGFDWL